MAEATKEISQEAVVLQNMLERGDINLPRLKALLAKVSRLGFPSAKRKIKTNKYADIR